LKGYAYIPNFIDTTGFFSNKTKYYFFKSLINNIKEYSSIIVSICDSNELSLDIIENNFFNKNRIDSTIINKTIDIIKDSLYNNDILRKLVYWSIDSLKAIPSDTDTLSWISILRYPYASIDRIVLFNYDTINNSDIENLKFLYYIGAPIILDFYS